MALLRPIRRGPAPAPGSTLRRLLFVLATAAPVACGEHGTATTEPEHPLEIVTRLECVANVRAATVTCSGEGAAPIRLSEGLRADLILGGQGQYMQLASSAVSYNSSTQIFQANVTVQNLIGQAIGTTDGSTVASTGIRVFFQTGPSVSSGTGIVTVNNASGTGVFTASNQPYFQYNQLLAASGGVGSTSSALTWMWNVPTTVNTFVFSVYVSAPVQYPNGWVSLAPSSATLAIGGTTTLTPTVKDEIGRTLTGQSVTYASSSDAVATVSSGGLVTGVASGAATITATSGVRTGTAAITVDAAPTVTSTTPTSAATAVVNTSTISITFSEPVTATTASFTLQCPSGTSKTFTLSSSPATTFTLTPTTSLPAGTTCTVTVIKDQIDDVDPYDPPSGLAANYTFSFATAIGAVNDTYPETVYGNTTVTSGNYTTPYSVTANDSVSSTATITFAGNAGTAGVTAQGGTVSMTTSGTSIGRFVYEPPIGFGGGNDTFTYTVTQDGVSKSATVTIPVGTVIWYVNNAAASCTSVASGCGRLTTPFSTLAALNSANNGTGSNPASGDAIFLYESASTYAGGLTLLASQLLVGQDATASLTSILGATPASQTLPAMNTAGNTATIAGTAGITLGSGNTLRGLTVSNTGGTGIAGTSFGTLTVSTDVKINASGASALSLTTGTLAGSFGQVQSTGGTNNVLLSSVSSAGSTLGTSADALAGATGDAFKVSGGAGTFTYAGSISNTATYAANVSSITGGTVTLSGSVNPVSAAKGITLTGNSGGTVTFSGTAKNISTSTTDGVTISGNTGGTYNFTNGGLAITTTSGRGLYASQTTAGLATVVVSGTGNTISSTTGTALTITNTLIGASGVTFQSVGSNGASSGILLSTTGSSGGLTVTGVGTTAGSGGTITNSTTEGISLTSTTSPSFSYMNVTSSGNNGIKGTTVAGLALTGMSVTSNGNVSGEGALNFSGLTGTATIGNTNTNGGYDFGLNLTNSSGTLALTVTGSTFSGTSSASTSGDGVYIAASSGATISPTFTGNTFTNNYGDHFSYTVNGASGGTLSFGSNTLSAGATSTLSGGVLVLATSSYSGTLQFDVYSNAINGSKTSGVQVTVSTGTTSTSIQGKVRSNNIGTSGSATNSCSTGANGIGLDTRGTTGSYRISVTDNTIYKCYGSGIGVTVGQTNARLDLTATGNRVDQLDATNGLNGLYIDAGATTSDAGTLCLNAQNNYLNYSAAAFDPGGIYLGQNYTGMNVYLPGLSPSPATATTGVQSYLNGRNFTAAGAAGTSTVFATTISKFVSGTCNTVTF